MDQDRQKESMMGMGIGGVRVMGATSFVQPQPGQTRAFPGTPKGSPGFPDLKGEVSGYSAIAVDLEIVAGLPEGVTVPGGALTAIAALKRLDVWIDKGRRTQQWAEHAGAADAEWVDVDGVLGLPESLRDEDAPAFVREWLSESAEISALVEQLLT